jgi:F-type H+-transporting ATPase subunit b
MADPVNPESARPVTELPAAEASEAVHGHEVSEGTSEVAAHGGEGGGLPQFRVEYWGGQIIWLLILFVLLYALLSRVFIPRLRRALDERENTIAGALAAARQVQTEADAQAAAGRAEVAEARARAGRTASEAKAAVEAERSERAAAEEAKLEQHLLQAEDRIRSGRDQAMTNVSRIARETAEALTEKLSGRPAAPGEIDAALTRGPA